MRATHDGGRGEDYAKLSSRLVLSTLQKYPLVPKSAYSFVGIGSHRQEWKPILRTFLSSRPPPSPSQGWIESFGFIQSCWWLQASPLPFTPLRRLPTPWSPLFPFLYRWRQGLFILFITSANLSLYEESVRGFWECESALILPKCTTLHLLPSHLFMVPDHC